MLRGDVDRFYRALRQEHPIPTAGQIRRLDHVREIAAYYAQLSQEDRHYLLAWAKKEESGIGIIPLALSGVPFFGLLLGSRIQEPFARLPLWAVYSTWILAAALLIGGFYVHQRQKAYTMLHIVLLEQAIKRDAAAPDRDRRAHGPERNRWKRNPEPDRWECEPKSQPPAPSPPGEADARPTLPPTPGTH